MEFMLTGRQNSYDFSSLEPTKANRALVLYILLQFFERQFLYKVQGQPFANASDFLLQLKQLFVSHLVWIYIVVVLSLKSHRENYVR